MYGDRVAIFETMTGRIVKWPAVSDVSFTQTINDEEGSLSVTTTRDEVNASESVPWKYSLALLNINDRVLAAGPIYKRSLSFDTGEVKLDAGSFWTFLKKRLWHARQEIARHGTTPLVLASEELTTYKQRYRSTMYGLAFGVVRSQLRGELPGVTDTNFPYPDGTHEREYDGRDVRTLAELVSDLFAVQHPPVIRWEARFSAASQIIEWRPEALKANDVDGTVNPATHWLLLDSDKAVVSSAHMNEDAGSLVNDSLVASKQQTPDGTDGNAGQSKVLYARWTARPAGMPLLQEADKSHDAVRQQGTVLGYAAGNATAQPYWSIEISLPRGEFTEYGLNNTVSSVRAGDWAALYSNEPFWGASTWFGRIEKVAGNLREVTISLERLQRKPDEGMLTDDMKVSVRQRGPGDGTTRLLETIRTVGSLNNPTT